MVARCVSDSGAVLPEDYLDERRGYAKSTRFAVAPGRDYVLYALTFRRNEIWYYVCGDFGAAYPSPFPAPLFDIVDATLSRFWRFAYTPDHLDHQALLAFREWIEDPYFYDRLTDGAEPEVSIFAGMRAKMDAEHAASGSLGAGDA